MQKTFIDYLFNLQHQQESMIKLLKEWVNINSGSENLPGLDKMFLALERSFKQFGVKVEQIPLPPRKKIDPQGHIIEMQVGTALRIIQRPLLKRRILLAGHMDTVYHRESSFQFFEMLEKDKMGGPGTADMKGGLVIMLKALETFENSPWSSLIGWEVLITPDEEIGSNSSEQLYLEAASRCQAALIFEPSFSDGALVSARKGSANYAVIARGIAAHAGRDFHLGRNAIVALSRFIVAVDDINKRSVDTTINIGRIEGGEATNVVPDLSICRLNVRATTIEELVLVDKMLKALVHDANKHDGIKLELFQEGFRAPKSFEFKTEALFQRLRKCGQELSMDIQWRPSGGVCDGNILSMAGVPCIDTLGAIGGNIHTKNEYIDLSSLPKRAMLTALLLMNLATDNL